MLGEAGLARAAPRFVTVVAGDRDEGYAREGRIGAQPLYNVITIDAGHADVEQHHVRPVHAGGFESRVAIVRDLHVVPDLHEEEAQAFGGVHVVIDHENAPAGLDRYVSGGMDDLSSRCNARRVV